MHIRFSQEVKILGTFIFFYRRHLMRQNFGFTKKYFKLRIYKLFINQNHCRE